VRTHLRRCAAGSDPGAEGLEDGRLYSGVDVSFLWKLITVINVLSVSKNNSNSLLPLNPNKTDFRVVPKLSYRCNKLFLQIVVNHVRNIANISSIKSIAH
jgi:hypothetical protein